MKQTLEKPALELLLDHNFLNLVESMASNFYRTYGKNSTHSAMITQEDLAREGFLGAVVAYDSFNPNLGHTDNINQSFRTYAYPYIKNAMLTFCRKFGHTLSISEKAARYDFGNMINIGIVHIDQLDETEEFDIPVGSGLDFLEDATEYFFAGCNGLEKNLVTDYIINDYSLEELSKMYKLSKTRAGEIIRDILTRARTRVEKYVEGY